MTFAERISAAIQRHAPPEHVHDWCKKRAWKCDVHPDTFERWYNGESSPESENLFKLCDAMGQEFEDEIRGRVEPKELTPEEHLEVVLRHAAEAMRALKAVK